MRNDLKQYTADAFVCVLVVGALGRAERRFSSRSLAGLAATIGIGFFFSAAAGVVGVAALVCLLVVAARCAEPGALRRALIATGAALVIVVPIYWLAYRPGVPPGLTQYWADYYLPIGHGLSATVDYLRQRGTEMSHYLGLHDLVIALVAVGIGVFSLWRRSQPALALLAPVLIVELMLLSAARRYPLFDERTSHFLAVVLALVAAVGLAEVVQTVARRQFTVAVGVGALAVLAFVAQVRPYLRSHSLPAEDLRTPTRYVAAHRSPGDVVLISSLSSWGFAYYWTASPPAIRADGANLQRFVADYPSQPSFVVAADRTSPAVVASLNQAVAAAGGHRIWVIRDHVSPSESVAWQQAFAAAGLIPTSVIGTRLLLLDG